MDGPHIYKRTPDDFSSPSASTRYTALMLSVRDDLRAQGDRELIGQLLNALDTAPDQALPAAAQPVIVSELSLLGQWTEVFRKAFNGTQLLDWADRRRLDFTTLRVRNGALEAKVLGQRTLYHFTLGDASGWWKVSSGLVFISQLLDPAELGMAYVGERVDNIARTLSLDRVLAFYGYPMPDNRLQAQLMVDELKTAQAFPAIDDAGKNRSLIHAERIQQQLDYLQLADALQAVDRRDGLALFRTRLHLASDSLLARTLKEAAQRLKLIVEDNLVEGLQADKAQYYYDHLKQVVQVLPRHEAGEVHGFELRPKTPHTRWDTLNRLAVKLGTDIYPDHSLSIAACLKAYNLERAAPPVAVTRLITRLRQTPLAPAPTLFSAARSLRERFDYSQHLGFLNDRHAMRKGLYDAISHDTLKGPQGLDAIINVDEDDVPVTLKPGRERLQALAAEPEFVALREKQGIAPDSHILLDFETGIGGRNLKDEWVSLTTEVLTDKKLGPLLRKLLPLAIRLGGQLRTNNEVSLRQALLLYGHTLPANLEEARLTARRLAITVPLRLKENDYWRALSPVLESQPIAWTLSDADRQQVLSLSRTVLPASEPHLFGYLAQPLLEGKSPADIRAEADLLMIRLIASPRAQQLAAQLSTALQRHGMDASEASGHGSRSALVWAALLLSLDPDVDTPPARINRLDWTGTFFWGESAAFVRQQLEHSFSRLDPGQAALAAHLMLCGRAPHLLVRGIPESLPYLATQTWTLFQQYTTYLEDRMPGAARQFSYDEIMYVAHLPPDGKWAQFLQSPLTAPAIQEWAVTNGLVQRQQRYSVEQTNAAIAALNALRARLSSAMQAFTTPVQGQRAIALKALATVYPQAALLDELLLIRLPRDSDVSEDSWTDNAHQGNKYSFVDLYMANELGEAHQHWHSTDKRLKYRELAPRFGQLKAFNSLFTQTFNDHLLRLQTAFVDYLLDALPGLTLPWREALEFGKVEFFALRYGTESDATFGLILCASFYRDRHVYECFPKHLLIRARHDLAYDTLAAAADSPGQDVSTLALDWPAYALGVEPIDVNSVGNAPGVRIRRLDDELPAFSALPPADADGHRIPRSLDSPRSRALVNLIVERHYLQGAAKLKASAAQVQTLEQVSRNEDPWADYLREVTLAVQ